MKSQMAVKEGFGAHLTISRLLAVSCRPSSTQTRLASSLPSRLPLSPSLSPTHKKFIYTESHTNLHKRSRDKMRCVYIHTYIRTYVHTCMHMHTAKRDKEMNQLNYIMLASEIAKWPLERPRRRWLDNAAMGLERYD
jgi:hypothetical protein